jgi:hypothetical protein
MQAPETRLSHLSQAAQLLLDYLVRYQRRIGVRLPKVSLERSLSGAYPLFRYLFPSSGVLGAAIEELERAGFLEAELAVSDAKSKERLHRSVLEWIKLYSSEIVERIPFRHIGEIADSGAEDDNVELLNERLKFLGHTDLSAAAGLSKQYSKALLEIGKGDVEKRRLIAAVADLAGLRPVGATSNVSMCKLPGQLYESDDFAPNTRFRMAIALVNCKRDFDSEFQAVADLAETNAASNLAFLLMGHCDTLELRMADLCRGRHAVLLRDSDLKGVVLSLDTRHSMGQVVFPQLPPSTLSPFRYMGPVTGDNFFGRKTELQRILNAPDASFTILGARTIGKTSLLQTARDMVNTGAERDSTIAVFTDATQNRQLGHFQKNLMQALLKEAGQRGVEIDWIDPGQEFFEDLSAALRKSGRKFLFLIDEIDNLILDPKIIQFEEFVRTMSNSRCARFVLSGYKNLRERTEDRDSFFYNLFEPITLSPLVRMEARELVRRQMARIYVEFESEQVVETILDLGSAFAAYLQRMCHLLLSRLDEPGRDRTIRLEDVRAVYDGEEFARAITSAVNGGGDRFLGVLERLILYWAAANPSGHFSQEELFRGLERCLYPLRLTEIRRAMQYLTATYLLAESNGRYRYYMPHLREKLRCVESEMNFVIERLAREYRELQHQM